MAGVKVEGEGEFMPGQMCRPDNSRQRAKTHLITNLAIMECAELPWAGEIRAAVSARRYCRYDGTRGGVFPVFGNFQPYTTNGYG